jgi:hypothetical protein
LIQPDVILPVQMLRLPARIVTAERRLMLAILSDAVWCFQRYCTATSAPGRRLFREAERWLLLRDWGWTFSFERICEALDLDASNLRQGLKRWQERQQNGTSRSHAPAGKPAGALSLSTRSPEATDGAT